MTQERKELLKQILDRFVSFIYMSVLYLIVIAVFLGIGFFFLFPYYEEYKYMHTCLQEGHQKAWCEQAWLEWLKLN